MAAPALSELLAEATVRAQECAVTVRVCHEAGYEPSRSQSNEPHVSGSRDRKDAPPTGERDARSAYRFGVRELARASRQLSEARSGKPHPMDVAVASDSIAPSLAQAIGVVTRAAYGFSLEESRHRETGARSRELIRAVRHLDRAVSALSPFRPETGARPKTHKPGRRRRDLEARA